VRVHVPQAGDHELSEPIDHGSACRGYTRARFVQDLGDPIAADHDAAVSGLRAGRRFNDRDADDARRPGLCGEGRGRNGAEADGHQGRRDQARYGL
jgi:hypothetical protein